MGQGPGIGQHHAAARRQRRLHRRHGHAGRQERPGFGKRSWRYSMLVRTAWCRRCSSSRKRKAIPLKCRTPTPCWRTSPQGQEARPGGRVLRRAARSAWKPRALLRTRVSIRSRSRWRTRRPRRRLAQAGHRAAGVHQRLADRRPGRPEGALRLTGIRHAGPGGPACRVAPLCGGARAPKFPAARVPAAPSGRRGDGRVPRNKANSPWARHRTTPYRSTWI